MKIQKIHDFYPKIFSHSFFNNFCPNLRPSAGPPSWKLLRHSVTNILKKAPIINYLYHINEELIGLFHLSDFALPDHFPFLRQIRGLQFFQEEFVL